MLTKSKIGSAIWTVAKTIIPFIETNTASVYKAMGKQLFQNFVKFDLISRIICIYIYIYVVL